MATEEQGRGHGIGGAVYIVAMLNPGEAWRAFERSDEAAVYGRLSYGEALERFERLWRHAREMNAELGSDWLEDLAGDFAVARAVNGLPPAA